MLKHRLDCNIIREDGCTAGFLVHRPIQAISLSEPEFMRAPKYLLPFWRYLPIRCSSLVFGRFLDNIIGLGMFCGHRPLAP
jgi:hypothetical protein